MIRDEPDYEASAPSGSQGGVLSALFIFFLVLGIGATLFVAGVNAPRLGWPAFVLLIGVGFVGVLCLIGHMSFRAAQKEMFSQSGHPNEAFIGAFMQSPEPALLVKSGKPWRANSAYMALARAVGAVGISDAPPTVDRIFGAAGKETASAIFRLHHMRDDTPSSEEYIDTLDETGTLRRFRVNVTGLGDTQLWQINDVTIEKMGQEATLIGAPVGLCSVDIDGRIVATNVVLDKWLGLETKVGPDYLREFVQDSAAILDHEPTPGKVIRSDTKLITQKGVVTPIIMTAQWHEIDDGERIASVALYGHSSIGVQPATAPAAVTRTSKGDMASANESFNVAPVAILELRGDALATSKIKRANPAFEAMGQGIFWRDIAFSDIFQTDPVGDGDMQMATTSGEPFDALLSGDKTIPVSVYVVSDPSDAQKRWVYLVDISARKSLEDQLFQSQKMQAIGQLAAGVAHDFNNLLTTIRLNTDELLGRHPVGDPSYRELHDINNTVNRAAALVKKLLAFSRKQTLRMELLNVTDTLSDLSVPLKQSLGERVRLDVIHGRGLPPIRADRTQLDQVLLNLCVNARDAMEPQGGGQITVRTSAVDRTVLESDGIQDIKGDAFVRVTFSDTGTGMTDEVKSKIFEPFFTTKEQGKGTGLGLATVYGIIQQSGGYLAVDSELGVGTTFKIYLPVGEKGEDEVVPVTPPKTEPKPVDLTGQGTILFVEDEVSVRTIAAKTLRKRGYKVIEAGDGEEAYEILEDGEDSFDLMISDVVMPSMDGPTLLRKGRHLLGEARIVFISGYAEEEFSDLLSEEPDVTFLPKPFTLSQLAEKVKAEIGESAV